MGDRPNVLVIMQDQLRYDAVHDPDLCRTPTLDALRREGMQFDRAYTPVGICSAARASMLTGLYPHTHRILNNCSGTDAITSDLSRDLPTLGELLVNAGYHTGYVGKWHAGVNDGPQDRGFKDHDAVDADLLDAHPLFWKRVTEGWPDVVGSRYEPANPRLAERFPRRPFPIYSTETVAEEVVPATTVTSRSADLLRSYAKNGSPFFLFVSFIEPHWPNVLPDPYATMYDPRDVAPWPNFADAFVDKPRANIAGLEHFGVGDFTWEQDWAPIVARYFGAVSFLDDLIGRLLTVLDKTGLADDTVVICSADHGDLTGSHRQFNKGPLAYEEVYRIPFIVRGPGIPSGATSDAFVSLIDLVPTAVDLAGGKLPDKCHGRSLVPLFTGEQEGWRDAFLGEFHGDEFGLCSQRMLWKDRFKLVYNAHDLRELYDLAADPHEMRNLAYESAYLEIRKDLEARLLELMHDTEDMLRTWLVNILG